MKSLIIGAGQVGSALKEVLSKTYEVVIKDIEDLDVKDVKVLHICYPDSEDFIKNTKEYVKRYAPELTIIHSSVSLGTTELCGDDVVYSPVRGRHPQLAEEMKSFTKFVSSSNPEKASKAKEYFEKCGWKVIQTQGKPYAVEFFKMFSNVHMGLEIAWRQEAERIMKDIGIDPMGYEAWEKTYRDGCIEVKDLNLLRPLMSPGPIGGHCILPCTEILKSQVRSPLFDFILESNEKVKNENLVTA